MFTHVKFTEHLVFTVSNNLAKSCLLYLIDRLIDRDMLLWQLQPTQNLLLLPETLHLVGKEQLLVEPMLTSCSG